MIVKPLEPGRCATVGGLLARAFEGDPVYSYLLPNAEKRRAQLAWLFERWTRAVAPLGAAYITDGGEGVAIWLPPDHGPNVSLWRLLRGGLATAPFRLGIGQLPRAWRVYADLARRHRAELREPHWILDVLAVDPLYQGRGVGSALMQHGITQADQDHTPCYVITHNPANVPYYERFGFRVLHAAEGSRFAWSLRRPAP